MIFITPQRAHAMIGDCHDPVAARDAAPEFLRHTCVHNSTDIKPKCKSIGYTATWNYLDYPAGAVVVVKIQKSNIAKQVDTLDEDDKKYAELCIFF